MHFPCGGLSDRSDREEMPLCCPTSTLYHIPHNCSQAPPGWTPEPKLSGATDAYFVYKGFPQYVLLMFQCFSVNPQM